MTTVEAMTKQVTAAARRARQAAARAAEAREERDRLIAALAGQGVPRQVIAKETGLSRTAIGKIARGSCRRSAAATPRPRRRNQMTSKPAPYRPDVIHVVRVRQHGAELYALARRSLIARLVRDAAAAGGADEIADLGPDALMLCQAAQRGEFGKGELLIIGIAKNGKWLQWNPPAPMEPVPGSPGATAARN